MYPLLFELGPLSIYSYGLLLATALMVLLFEAGSWLAGDARG